MVHLSGKHLWSEGFKSTSCHISNKPTNRWNQDNTKLSDRNQRNSCSLTSDWRSIEQSNSSPRSNDSHKTRQITHHRRHHRPSSLQLHRQRIPHRIKSKRHRLQCRRDVFVRKWLRWWSATRKFNSTSRCTRCNQTWKLSFTGFIKPPPSRQLLPWDPAEKILWFPSEFEIAKFPLRTCSWLASRSPPPPYSANHVQELWRTWTLPFISKITKSFLASDSVSSSRTSCISALSGFA